MNNFDNENRDKTCPKPGSEAVDEMFKACANSLECAIDKRIKQRGESTRIYIASSKKDGVSFLEDYNNKKP
jgi:hypothetical protein